jgi:multiple sugar transport system substrate-binding protein
MKKISALWLLCVGLTLAACSQKNTTTENTANNPTTITVIGENSSTIQALQSLEKDYESKNPTINLDFKPSSFDDAFNKSNQDFANGTGLYDIVMQYNFSLSSFVRNDYVYKIDDLLKDVPDSLKAFEQDLFPNAWKEVGYYQDDKTGLTKVGYPFAANSMLLMYNKTLFENPKQREAYKAKYKEDLQVPTTWEQFYRVAEFFTQPQNKTYGVCLQGAGGGWLYYEFCNFLYGMGGKTTEKENGWQGDANTKVLLNTPEALAALKFYKKLKPFNAGNWSNVEQVEQMKIMKEGKTALAIVWSDMLFPMLATNDVIDNRFGFAPVAANKSVLAGGAFFINKRTKNARETAQYILDVMQPATQIALAKKGLCSANRKVYENEEVRKLSYSDALYKSLERGGVVLEAGPDATMIAEKMTTYIQKCWNDELTPEKALEQMQKEIEAERKKIFEALKQ